MPRLIPAARERTKFIFCGPYVAFGASLSSRGHRTRVRRIDASVSPAGLILVRGSPQCQRSPLFQKRSAKQARARVASKPITSDNEASYDHHTASFLADLARIPGSRQAAVASLLNSKSISDPAESKGGKLGSVFPADRRWLARA
jgi:hypothetical protein